jgi:hypothetical protein
MTQSQHTQGPWYAHTTFISGETDNIAIAQCSYRGEVDLDEAMANAKLIAAAPELLETLTYLKAHLSEMVADELPALLEEGPTSELILSRLDSYTAKIDNAINKAKGETAQC